LEEVPNESQDSKLNKYCENCKHLYHDIMDYCTTCDDPNTGHYGLIFGRDVETNDYRRKTKFGERWSSQW